MKPLQVEKEIVKMDEPAPILEPSTFETFSVILCLKTKRQEDSKYILEKLDCLIRTVKTVPSIKEIEVISVSGIVGDFSYEIEKK